MKFTITPNQAMDYGIWEKICEIKGYDLHCVNEGAMDGEKEIRLNVSEFTEIHEHIKSCY